MPKNFAALPEAMPGTIPGSAESPRDHIDHVYHLTTTDHPEIFTQGLQPNPERGRELAWRQLEAFLDDHRPQPVRDMGISRLHSVFAHPYLEAMGRGAMGMHQPLEAPGARRVALEVAVDPDRVAVCDASELDGFTAYFDEEISTWSEEKTQAAQRYAQRYWGTGLTLAQFRDCYEATHTPWGSVYARREEAPSTLPYHMLQPEVLIPGEIPATDVTWVATSIEQQ